MSVAQGSTVRDIVASPPRREASAERALLPGRTPAGITVAALLAGVAWAGVAEVVSAMAGLPVRPSSLWSPALRSATFDHPAVPAVAMAMIAGGAALVTLAVLPGRPHLVPLRGDDPLLAIGLTRAGLRRALAAAAASAGEGVAHARVRVLRRQVEVTVVTDAERAGELLREVGAAVGDRLSGLGAQGYDEVVVRLREGR